MNRCVICSAEDLSEKWSRIAGKFVCSHECAAIENSSNNVTMAIISSLIAIVLVLAFPAASFLIVLIFIPLISYYISEIRLAGKYQNLKKGNHHSESSQILRKQRGDHLATYPAEHPTTIFVYHLGREYHLCCYQTARLGEYYCICGRRVDPRLSEFLKVVEH